MPSDVLIDPAEMDVQGPGTAAGDTCPHISSMSLPTLDVDGFCIQILTFDAFSDKMLNSRMSQQEIESL